MRNKFPGYYHPSTEEFAELWKDCIFAFDANVLLNLYRYTTDTKNSLLAVLKKIVKRIWLPYQSAFEYHNRRLDVIQRQMRAYDEVFEIIKKSRDELSGRLSGFIKHPSIQIHEILKSLDDAVMNFEKTLTKLKQTHPDFLIDDPIKEHLSKLFDGRVGESTAEKELTKIYKLGEERYKLNIPPGYEDRQKGGTAQYNDLVMWFQLIAKAEESKKPMIFVTDDRKEDWWLKSGGRTIGPRPELVQEISEKAGTMFYMYSADPFMQYANMYLKQNIEKAAIDEVKEVRKRDEESWIRASDAINKVWEDAKKTRFDFAAFPAYEVFRKMAEDFEKLKGIVPISPAYDVWQKIAQDAEKTRFDFEASMFYEKFRNMAEAVEKVRLAYAEKMSGSSGGEKTDDAKTGMEDKPGS